MTTGQRIAARRKERGMSQEALGEVLGVSRQSIYKWESDSSLPEIDKLISLSRLFGVSVGWLLGVEEEGENAPAPFTPEQERMVEEILRRAQENGVPQLKSKWEKRAAPVLCVLCAVLTVSVLGLNQKLDRTRSQFDYLAGSLSNLSQSVDGQIRSVTWRMEELFDAQNSLVAAQVVRLDDWNYLTGTASFHLRVTPKTYTSGMTAVFLADDGEEVREFAGELREGSAFGAEFTCPMSREIAFSAVLTAGGVSQTEELETFYFDERESLPQVNLNAGFSRFSFRSQTGEAIWSSDEDVYVSTAPAGDPPAPSQAPAEVESIRVGLFRNRELVQWLDSAGSLAAAEVRTAYRCILPAGALPLEEGDRLDFAALCTDTCGRQFLAAAGQSAVLENGVLTQESIAAAVDYSGDYSNLAEWKF